MTRLPVRRLLLPGLRLAAYVMLARSRPRVAAPVPEQDATRARAAAGLARGRMGEGGLHARWPDDVQAPSAAAETAFQYADLSHQSETAVAGMWLFLATEALFFGGLFLLYATYRAAYPDGFAEAARHARIGIGTANTVLLLSSSAVFAWGLGQARKGENGRLFHACAATMALGFAFVALKLFEWKLDFDDRLFPGASFSIGAAAEGPAKLFWSFYFVGTGLHLVHMAFGIALVAWIALNARRGRYTPSWHTPVEVVGLYWSFVDMVWLMLFATIYMAAPR